MKTSKTKTTKIDDLKNVAISSSKESLCFTGNHIILRDMKSLDLDSYWYWLRPGHRWQEFDGPYYQDHKMEKDLLEQFENRKRKVLSGDFPTPRTWLVIADKTTDELIGIVSSYWRSKETFWYCAGITILNDKNWGKGIGTEALTLWTDYLFANRPEICRLGLETWSGNEGLIHLAKKLGFCEEARFRKARIVKGKYYDALGFGILREEWEAKPKLY